MNTKIIESIIETSPLPQMQKNMFKAFMARATEQQDAERKDRELVETIANAKNLAEVVLSTDEVKIYTVSPSLDIAYLVYLQSKHLGANNQFADFAIKMLEII